MRLLLEAKADVESRDEYGHTPLWTAAYNGHDAVVRLLLEAKADVESNNEGRTHTAVARGLQRARCRREAAPRGQGRRRVKG